MVADALVYHPSVAHYLRFVATTRKSSLHYCSTDTKPNNDKSAETKPSAQSNTSPASTPGTSSAPTIQPPRSRLGTP